MENPCESKASIQTSPKEGMPATWEWFDNTTITEYQKCPRKAYLKYQKHYRSPRESTILNFGIAHHKCKELTLLGREGEVGAIIDAYQPPQDEDLRTQLKLKKCHDVFKAERMPPRWEETLSVEEPISFPIGEFKFVVKPDCVIKWRGGIFGYESKHTARLTNTYFDAFKRNSQVDAQMLGIREKFGMCQGIYVEATVIRKGGPTSKLKEVEIITDIQSRSPQELEEAKEYFHNWMKVITADKQFLENKTSCFNFGVPCEFIGLCNGNITNPEEYYTIRKWDPWASDTQGVNNAATE